MTYRLGTLFFCALLIAGCDDPRPGMGQDNGGGSSTDGGSSVIRHDGSTTAPTDGGTTPDGATANRDATVDDPDGGGTLGPVWVRIEPGTFMMGSPESEPCREAIKETLHSVTITRPFEMSATETTQGEYAAVMGENPSYRTSCGLDCPVENLTWHMAAAYCNALSAGAGLTACYECTGTGRETECAPAAVYAGGTIQACPGYRLPTEAEWEYAYRAGTNSALYNGVVDPELCSGADPNALEIGWFIRNTPGGTQPVGRKMPNAWGLYDMAGNAQEWVEDFYLQNLGSSAVTDPVVIEESDRGVIRGGSFAHGPNRMRGAFRVQQSRQFDQGISIGFRPVRTLGS